MWTILIRSCNARFGLQRLTPPGTVSYIYIIYWCFINSNFIFSVESRKRLRLLNCIFVIVLCNFSFLRKLKVHFINETIKFNIVKCVQTYFLHLYTLENIEGTVSCAENFSPEISQPLIKSENTCSFTSHLRSSLGTVGLNLSSNLIFLPLNSSDYLLFSHLIKFMLILQILRNCRRIDFINCIIREDYCIRFENLLITN
jgi:hypothetical protein